MSQALPGQKGLHWRHAPFLMGVALLLPRLLAFAEVAFSLLLWPWQFDYDEGINLNAAVELARGTNIYRPNGPEGFISAPYTPLLYLLTAPFLLFMDFPSLWPGRALSLLATLGIAVLIGWVVRRAGGLWSAGMFAGALWLSLSPTVVWSTLFKQDMPALALGLGGLALALKFNEGRKLYVAVLLFALAFYTKQSALAAGAAATLWLLARDMRAGLRFVGALVLLIPVPFLVVNLLLRSGLWEHVIGNHAPLPWRFGQIDRTWSRVIGEYWPLLLWVAGASLITVALLLRDRREGSLIERARAWLSSRGGLILIYLTVGAGSSLYQMGYVGGNHNHSLDLLLPLCIVAGWSASWVWVRLLEARVTARRAVSVVGMVLVVLALGAQLFVYGSPRTWYRGGWPSEPLDRDMQNLSRLVRDTHGEIYSEDATLLLRNGKRVLYDDPSTFVPLAEAGLWDDRVFNESLRGRRFPLLLLQQGSGRFTPEARKAFGTYGEPKFRSIIETYEAPLHPREPDAPLRCTLGGGDERVHLRGYALGPGVAYSGVPVGGVLYVTLYWEALGPLGRDYASYVHVVSEGGEKVAGRDNPATGAEQPTSRWEVGQEVRDLTSVPLPRDLKPGRYRVIAGMYGADGASIVPLEPACSDAGEAYGTAVSLGWIEVKGGKGGDD